MTKVQKLTRNGFNDESTIINQEQNRFNDECQLNWKSQLTTSKKRTMKIELKIKTKRQK